jgi:putative copper resistance protein D
MIDVGLVLARLLHYVATTTLAGMSFFPLYAYANCEPEIVGLWRRRLLLWTAVAALISGLLWFVFVVANMSGSLVDLADPEVAWSVARDTGFGTVWTARMLLAGVIVGVAAWRHFSTTTDRRDLITSLLAAALLGSLAGTGHSQIEEGWERAVHVASGAAHLLAAGAWLGGLVPLGHILFLFGRDRGIESRDELNTALLRFSGMGYLAVATLVGSGLVHGWFLIGSVSGLFVTPYGKLLVVKLGLFAGMLALAISNRFWIVPALTKTWTDSSNDSTVWTSRLRNHVLGEQFLGFMILLVVSVLGIMQPATGQ